MGTELEVRDEMRAFQSSLQIIKSNYTTHTDYALRVSDTSGGKLGLHAEAPSIYALPHQMQALRATPTYGLAASPNGQSDVDDAVEELHRALQDPQAALVSVQQSASTEAQAIATEMQQTKNTSSFREQMEALKLKTKEHLDEIVEKVFNSSIQVGEAHPAAQEHILNSTQKVVNFIDGIVTSIVNFVTSIINNIATWVREAVTKVKAFFTTSIDSVAHFFSSL